MLCSALVESWCSRGGESGVVLPVGVFLPFRFCLEGEYSILCMCAVFDFASSTLAKCPLALALFRAFMRACALPIMASVLSERPGPTRIAGLRGPRLRCGVSLAHAATIPLHGGRGLSAHTVVTLTQWCVEAEGINATSGHPHCEVALDCLQVARTCAPNHIHPIPSGPCLPNDVSLQPPHTSKQWVQPDLVMRNTT